jgi:hypothetical protein
MAYSPQDLIRDLVAKAYQADQSIQQWPYNPFRTVAREGMTPIGMAGNTQPWPHTQSIGSPVQTGYNRPHTNEALVPAGITPYKGNRVAAGGNQAKINISMPAERLFATDNSEMPRNYTPIGQAGPSIYANMPYPEIGMTPGAAGYTPIGQAGESYTPGDMAATLPSATRGK